MGQRRAVDGAAFVEHPLEVATLLRDVGAPDHVVAAGALHDVLEDTNADATQLRERFGPQIAELVVAVSEDDTIRGYAERKAALRRQVARAGRDAQLIFAADKISKVRELMLEAGPSVRCPRPRHIALAADRRVAHYRRSLQMLDGRLDSPLVEQLRGELERLAKPPAGPVALAG